MFKFIKGLFKRSNTTKWPHLGENGCFIELITSTGHHQRGDLCFKINYHYSNDSRKRFVMACQKDSKEDRFKGNCFRPLILTPEMTEKILGLKTNVYIDLGEHPSLESWLLSHKKK